MTRSFGPLNVGKKKVLLMDMNQKINCDEMQSDNTPPHSPFCVT